MSTATISIACSVAGVTIQGAISRAFSGGIGQNIPLPVAGAGSLTTRTDENTGVVTLAANHPVVTGKVDVYWADGVRYGVDATVNVNACAIDLGAGDNLPDNLTPVTVCNQITIDMDVAADLMQVLAWGCTVRAHIDFQSGAGVSLLARELIAAAPWFWAADLGIDNPMAGDTIGQVKVSNASPITVGTLNLGLGYDSDS